jgi:hypothetical protein
MYQASQKSIAKMRHKPTSNLCSTPFVSEKRHNALKANSHRWQGIILALVLGGMLAGCGGAALTSNVLSGNATGSYLDTVQHANPTGVNAAATGLKIAISSRGDNTTERLVARVNEAQGTCDRSNAMVRCVLDKSIVERSCFQGRCGESRKRWMLLISWRDAPGVIDPQVTLKMSWPERP